LSGGRGRKLIRGRLFEVEKKKKITEKSKDKR